MEAARPPHTRRPPRERRPPGTGEPAEAEEPPRRPEREQPTAKTPQPRRTAEGPREEHDKRREREEGRRHEAPPGTRGKQPTRTAAGTTTNRLAADGLSRTGTPAKSALRFCAILDRLAGAMAIMKEPAAASDSSRGGSHLCCAAAAGRSLACHLRCILTPEPSGNAKMTVGLCYIVLVIASGANGSGFALLQALSGRCARNSGISVRCIMSQVA